MATVMPTETMTLEELADWLKNRKVKAHLYLAFMDYNTRDEERELCVQFGQVGYFHGRSWIRLERGDVVRLPKGRNIGIL